MKKVFLCLCMLSGLLFAGENSDAFAKYEKAIIASGQFPLSSWLIVTSPSSKSDVVNVKDYLPDEAAKINNAAEEAREYLKGLPPKDVWEFTMNAFEKKTFKGMKTTPRFDELDEAAKKANVTSLSKSFTGEAADLYTAEAETLLYDKSGLKFSYSYSSIALFWTKQFGIPIMTSPKVMYYWWYEGRKYLPEIWKDWYACWQKEVSREQPRKTVLENLAADINSLSYHIAPFVYKAIKDGDESLTKYFKGVKPVDGAFSRNVEPYTSWWEREKEGCTLPPCEGFEAASKRLGNVSEIFDEDMLKTIRNLSEAAKEYYSKPREKSSYWYYNLADDQEYDGEDAAQKFNEALVK